MEQEPKPAEPVPTPPSEPAPPPAPHVEPVFVVPPTAPPPAVDDVSGPYLNIRVPEGANLQTVESAWNGNSTPVELPSVEERPYPAEPPYDAESPYVAPATQVAAAAMEEPAEPAGSNMMLAVVCWIAGATSLFEAYTLFTAHWTRSYAFSGYLTLGLGVLLFSLEALSWGRQRRQWNFWTFVPAAVLTVAGVVCLALSQAPGRRI